MHQDMHQNAALSYLVVNRSRQKSLFWLDDREVVVNKSYWKKLCKNMLDSCLYP